MTAQIKRALLLLVSLSVVPNLSIGAKLMCPEAPEDSHRKEIVATSAPEVKVRANAQDDSRRWAEIVKPLTQKAIKAAKAQRAIAIQEGIEHGCPSNQTFVGQFVPAPDRASGCEHKIVTRPGDEGHVYVQVIAVCKYDWMCCTNEESVPAHVAPPASSKPTGYKLEGPITGNAGGVVQSSGATTAPSNPKLK